MVLDQPLDGNDRIQKFRRVLGFLLNRRGTRLRKLSKHPMHQWTIDVHDWLITNESMAAQGLDTAQRSTGVVPVSSQRILRLSSCTGRIISRGQNADDSDRTILRPKAASTNAARWLLRQPFTSGRKTGDFPPSTNEQTC